MKSVTITGRQKSSKQSKKLAAKNLTSAGIARRYMELCRLREKLSEAEAQRPIR